MTTNHDALPVAWLRPSVAPHYHAPATHWGAKPPEPLSADEALACGWFPVFKAHAAQPQAQGERSVCPLGMVDTCCQEFKNCKSKE